MTRNANFNRRFWRAVWTVLIIVGVMLLLSLTSPARASTLTGNIQVAGQPFNGSFRITLSYPSTGSGSLQLPGTGARHYVSNGTFTAFSIPGNDTLQPRGSYYLVSYYDATGAEVAELPYSVTGSTFDLGAAVPLPVTTANVSFLDLTGLRSIVVQSLTVTGSFNFPTGYFNVAGISGVKTVGDVRYASGWQSSSSTCGIQEAENDLPSTGGTIIAPVGSCTVTGAIGIGKPTVIQGQAWGSTLVNQGGSTLIYLNGSAGGTVIRDITLTGQSGTSTVFANSNLTLQHVVVNGNAGEGVRFAGAWSGGRIIDSVVSSQVGVHITDSVDDVEVRGSTVTGTAGAGLQIEGGGLVRVNGGVFTGTTRGIWVAPIASGVRMVAQGVKAVSGSGDGITIAAGVYHSITSSYLTGSSAWGVNITGTTPVSLVGNSWGGNGTGDVHAGAGGNTVIVPGASTPSVTDDGGAVRYLTPYPQRVCNGNGCYTVAPDGTQRQWGRSPSTTISSGANGSVSVTFANPFTSTTNLVVTTSATNQPNPSTGKSVLCYADYSTLTTSGITFRITLPTEVGGGGANLPTQALQCAWQADGY